MTKPHIGQEALQPTHRLLEDPEEPYVFTTVRWDSILEASPENTAASCNRPCPFYQFEHHYTRLQVAKWGTPWYTVDRPGGSHKNGGPSTLLYHLLTAVKQYQTTNRLHPAEALRCKLRSYPDGTNQTEVVSIPRLSLDRLFTHSFGQPDFLPEGETIDWNVAIDLQPTEPSEITMYKTSNRICYARARAAANISSLATLKEVLLYTPENLLFDASISTPYVYRDGHWITPSSLCGGQQGATRRWALEQRLAVEGEVRIESLRDGEVIWLSNGVRGYFRGKVVLEDREVPDEETVREIHHQLTRQGVVSDYLPPPPTT